MKIAVRLATAIAIAGIAIGAGRMDAQDAGMATVPGVPVDQGSDWTSADRLDFYSRDQGSRIMPLAWFAALERPDGAPFAADLTRYGYLSNPASADRLPIGFTVDSRAPGRSVGMTCAACHTREIEEGGTRYRIDGGPAIADFQGFLTDLDGAVARALATPDGFAAFAGRVRQADPGAADPAALRADLSLWYRRYHTLIVRALPQAGWGLGRLDAVSMIFNRLTGLDLGPPPDFLIPDNIAPADAPVRYPYIWDAPRQDHTQWPGFAANGDRLLGLTRNLGEVYGVFGVFTPHPSGRFLLGYDYVTGNSADFSGLRALEALVGRIGSPKWPWPTDPALIARGQAVFARSTADGGCQECHGIRNGAVRLVPLSLTWKTPLVDVGTDTRQYHVLARTASTGALRGALTPSLGQLPDRARSFDILSTSVIGSILQHDFALVHGQPAKVDPSRAMQAVASPVRSELTQAFVNPVDQPAVAHLYEARVLRGIWATAPYLHNGSVPTLAELLKPPRDRVTRFDVGVSYDRQAVGLAAVQPGRRETRVTTGCDQLDSGDSHCGHDYGTWLGADDKRALLEYLKVR